MKQIVLLAALIGCCVPLHAQRWCFSQNCTDTKGPIFSTNIAPNGPALFRPSYSLPTYVPVVPIRFSPITSQFFINRDPLTRTGYVFELQPGSNVIPLEQNKLNNPIAIRGTAATHVSVPRDSGFSTGQIGFTQPH